MAIRRHDLAILKSLKACRSLSKRRALLTKGGRPVQKLLREISYNLLKGNLKLNESATSEVTEAQEGDQASGFKGTSFSEAKSSTPTKGGAFSGHL